MEPLYEIGASLANSAASETDPFEDASTVFIFGNADNPDLSANQTPTQTDTTTASTALPGGTSEVSNAAATGAGTALPGTAAATPGLSTTTILLIAGVAILVIHHFFKK